MEDFQINKVISKQFTDVRKNMIALDKDSAYTITSLLLDICHRSEKITLKEFFRTQL